jgi:hypothetical protein
MAPPQVGRPNRPESVAHFLGLLIRAQSPVGMGVIGQNYWVQKPVKEFVPKRAFLDTPRLNSGEGTPYELEIGLVPCKATCNGIEPAGENL